MAEHPNAARVQRALEARARGTFDEQDTTIILDAFTDDAIWHMTGNSAWAADVRGKDALLAQWRAVAEASGDSFKVELHEMFADDDHAIGISTIRARNGERTMEMKEIQVFHLTPDGKISEFWGIVKDQDELDAFWAPPAAEAAASS
jgi:ketosteroid isomerase-like protein